MADLGIVHAAYGAADKIAAAAALVDGLGLDWDRVAAMGDDWPDLPILRRAAFACAPPHAHVEVRAVAHHVTAAAAGHGAAREFCDLLLVAVRSLRRACCAAPCSRSMERDEPVSAPASGGFEDDDEVDLSFAGPEPVAAAPWPLRLLDLVSAYLPLLMMAVLASGTWWLVRNAPERRARRARPRRCATRPTTR